MVDALLAMQVIVLVEINVLFQDKSIHSVNSITVLEFVAYALMDIIIIK